MIYHIQFESEDPGMLMTTCRGVNQEDPINADIKKLTDIKASDRTAKDHADLRWLCFLRNLYWDDKIEVFLPARNFIRAFGEAGTSESKGTAINKRGAISPIILCLKLTDYGFEKIDREIIRKNTKGNVVDVRSALFDAGYSDTRPVNPAANQGKISMVMETRPFFPYWKCEGLFRVNMREIKDEGQLLDIVNAAGEHGGVGAYKQVFGRFKTKCQEVSAQDAEAMRKTILEDSRPSGS